VTQFVEKDPQLAEPVLLHILEYWPRTFSAKEVLFLNEVEEILEMVQGPEFKLIMKQLFTRIALCVGSPHFQVAERALFLWNNEYIVSLIAMNRNEVLPLVFEALYMNSRNHWNSTVHGLTCNVVKLFMEMDSTLFDCCSNEHRELLDKKEAEDKQREERWKAIVQKAEANPASEKAMAASSDGPSTADELCYSQRQQRKKAAAVVTTMDTGGSGLGALMAGMESLSLSRNGGPLRSADSVVSLTPTTDKLRATGSS